MMIQFRMINVKRLNNKLPRKTYMILLKKGILMVIFERLSFKLGQDSIQ